MRIGMVWYSLLLLSAGIHVTNAVATLDAGAQQVARNIFDETGISGGFVVHLGCSNGKLTAALGTGESYLVHGLDTEAKNVETARKYILSCGLYGKVSIDRLEGETLPYINNLVNLVVAEDLGIVSMNEVLRVLAPNGVAYVNKGGYWEKTVKPRPKQIDEWTHYMHDATGNPVAQDTVVGPPRRLQWTGSPRYARHHDNMSSMNALVSAGGRIFYVMDEASRFSILTAPKWKLIARDAFNGTILWKRDIPEWFDHLHTHKNGPAELPRRLVAQDDRVYVTLGLDAPIVALDAATGKTVRTYRGTKGAEEILFSGGVLYTRITPSASLAHLARAKHREREGFTEEGSGTLLALQADSGKTLWRVKHSIVKLSMTVDEYRVVFLGGDRIVCLDRKNGKTLWRSEPVSRAEKYLIRSGPTVVLYDGVVLYADSKAATVGNRSWDTGLDDTLIAMSAKDGTLLWKASHPLSGYASPEDVFVVNGVVWYGETTSGYADGKIIGRDVYTGKLVKEFNPDVDTYWFHHRCHRGKATVNYLMMSRTGIEYVDVENEHWDFNHWIRGACLYGIMPANGLTYAPQHPCACFPEAKLSGFNAVAPEGSNPIPETPAAERLVQGPAYQVNLHSTNSSGHLQDWPTFRHDNARSGGASTTVPVKPNALWKTTLGGKLSSPVIADGRVFVATVNTHTVHALDAYSGEKLWSYTTGGRVDSPPTIHQGMALFGSCDGYVYCLRAKDGVLIWRFLAAPSDRRLMSFEQLESVWPVPGSVLVQNDVLYFVVGRSSFLDGGMRLYRLEPKTGKVLSETLLDERDRAGGKAIQDYARQHNMPVSLPDILSSDGRLVYMRSQPFDLSGKRLPLKALPFAGDPHKYSIPSTQEPEFAHLFSPTSFTDDSWWHRTYWVYGSRFLGGWAGYAKAGQVTPSGKILVFDHSNVYGFGRKPQYYRWSTPIEHHLFCAAIDPSTVTPEKEKSKKPRKGAAAAFKVAHRWTKDLPLLARAVVLANGTLFVAGPEDLVDENAVGKGTDVPGVAERLRAQEAAYAGKRGGMLWAVSAKDGQTLSETPLDEIPVFAGMAAAAERLYMATVNGSLICLGKRTEK
jgi:outer membrane protein assembly factor BamB